MRRPALVRAWPGPVSWKIIFRSPAGSKLLPHMRAVGSVYQVTWSKGLSPETRSVPMIKKGEVQQDTPLRMGGRPWYAAGKIGDFRGFFQEEVRTGGRVHAGLMDQIPGEDSDEIGTTGGTGSLFHENIPEVFPYPIRAGVWQPLVIFAGIAFALSAVLCLDLTLGLAVNLLGWPILYGYLTSVMQRSMSSPDNPPPEWDFSAVKEMLLSGAKVFAILIVSSFVPSGLLLIAGVTFFLNSMQTMGNVSILLACVVFAGSLFVAPAGLVILATSEMPPPVKAKCRQNGLAVRPLAIARQSRAMYQCPR